MTMKLANAARSGLNDIYKMPAGPDRMARFLRLLDADVALLPLSSAPPVAVAKAHADYLSATSVARKTAEGVETAKEAAGTAAGADLSAAMQAIQAGKITPKPTTQLKAADAIAAALTFTTAAEKLVGEAHEHLVDSVRDEWPTWRAQLVKDAASAHAAAAEAMEAAAAAVAAARGLYTAVGSLDLGVLGRDPKILEAVTAERRGGLAWYSSTCAGQPPLQRVNVPGVSTNGRPHASDLAVVVEALRLAVAAPADFGRAEWSPPGDEGRAALRDTPLDLSAPWVVAAVRHEWGTTCVVCRQPQADTVADDTDGALAMVHARCKNRPPDPVELKRQAARAAMSRRGYDAQPGQTEHWQRP